MLKAEDIAIQGMAIIFGLPIDLFEGMVEMQRVLLWDLDFRADWSSCNANPSASTNKTY